MTSASSQRATSRATRAAAVPIDDLPRDAASATDLQLARGLALCEDQLVHLGRLARTDRIGVHRATAGVLAVRAELLLERHRRRGTRGAVKAPVGARPAEVGGRRGGLDLLPGTWGRGTFARGPRAGEGPTWRQGRPGPTAVPTAAARTQVGGAMSDDDVVQDRRGLAVLDLETCLRHLRDSAVGRVAFPVGGDVVVLPVTHVVDGTSVAFRTTWGSKLHRAVVGLGMSFEVDAFDVGARTGWSVLVVGRAETVWGLAADRLTAIAPAAWVVLEDSVWVRIRADEVSGRELRPPRDSR